MTVTDDVETLTTGALAAEDAKRLGSTPPPGGSEGGDDRGPQVPLAVQVRPALAAALATAAAGLVVGGIFGSWLARAFGLFSAVVGAAWALYAARSERTTTVQAVFPAGLLLLSIVALIGAGDGPGELPTLVRDAIDAGRTIRPPVPFDPGWRVLLIGVIGAVGFGTSTLAIGGRPRLAVLIPLPLVGLASVTQPESEQFIAGVFAFLPVLAAIGVLFGGDPTETETLDRTFEMRRLIRGVAVGVPLVVLLVVFNSANFLFPDPVVDPDDRPQKPKAQPLSAADDRVLFEVATESVFTGPWRIGALDVYEQDEWLIPGFNRDRMDDVPSDGTISDLRASAEQSLVTITVRDLGNTAVLPVLGGTTRVVTDAALLYDPRSVTLRVPVGRVPAGLVYDLHVPDYATSDELEAVTAPPGAELVDRLAVPPPPDEIARLIEQAPPNPWKRLDALRQELLDNVTAKGAGAPIAVEPGRVVELITGAEPGTPFEIVAAEALLARWTGIPSRIGFGFDGLNVEDGVFTVRPRNSAQWLEVWFEGFGWVPLIGTPRQAQSSLDSDPNARFNPTIQPSDDVVVDVYFPFELEDLTELYQRIRDVVLRFLPLAVVVAAAWIGWPIAAKARRRSKRRRWAAARGPRNQIAVEYAEFRDMAIDLGVGDIYDSPLEYVSKVRDDAEHREFAWLASRALYGDLMDTVTEDDVVAAEELSASLRRRLAAGQTLGVRLLAYVSRASLEQPFTSEIPNVAYRLGRYIPGWDRATGAVRRLRRSRVASGVRRLAGDPR